MLQLLELKHELGLGEVRSNFSLMSGHLSGFFAAGGTGFLQFFHSQVQYCICDRYGLARVEGVRAPVEGALETQLHQTLGSYFARIVGERLEGVLHQNDEHALREVVYHLMQGGEASRARAFLLDMDFLFLTLRTLTVDALLEDFDLYLARDQDLPMLRVRAAVEMSRLALALDPQQVSLQLFSKLSEVAKESDGVKKLIDPAGWRMSRHPSNLLPRLWSGLYKPGGPLVATLTCGKRCQVTEVTEPFPITIPGKGDLRVVLATTDENTMLMWDLGTRTVLHVFKGMFRDTPKRVTFVPGSGFRRCVVTGYQVS